jgi:hypothetical protein
MSKIEKGKLALLHQLDAMSKGEVTLSARELRDYELEFANGGLRTPYMKYNLEDVIVSS